MTDKQRLMKSDLYGTVSLANVGTPISMLIFPANLADYQIARIFFGASVIDKLITNTYDLNT